MTDENKMLSISKKLKEILDNVLATGDWESSLFLKTSAKKLRDLKSKVEKLSAEISGVDQTVGIDKSGDKIELQVGSSRVFILVYQVEGTDLQGWARTIKTLVEYGVTRPAYKEEDQAREFIRAKVSNTERNGYVIVNVKDEAFYQVDQQVDALGNQLFALRENAIKLENIIEFVHANKKRYAVRENELVFLSEI